MVRGQHHVSGLGGGALQRPGSPARAVYVVDPGLSNSGGIDSGIVGHSEFPVEGPVRRAF